MKYIITESQHSLLRRMNLFETYLEEILPFNDPCDYAHYKQYRRVVIHETLGMILSREKLNNVFKTIDDVDNFRDNVLIPFFDGRIREHYDFFEEIC